MGWWCTSEVDASEHIFTLRPGTSFLQKRTTLSVHVTCLYSWRTAKGPSVEAPGSKLPTVPPEPPHLCPTSPLTRPGSSNSVCAASASRGR